MIFSTGLAETNDKVGDCDEECLDYTDEILEDINQDEFEPFCEQVGKWLKKFKIKSRSL